MIRLLIVFAFGLLMATALAVSSPSDDTLPGRWPEDKINQWYDRQPWLVGCNFTPSTAVNQLEMWQAETFDPETIDRELGWAAGLGMNTVRVYLHDILWEQDSKGFLARMDRFLSTAEKHGIRPLFVFFDACWNPHPKAGPQPPPRPHIHNSGWVQSPHIDMLRDFSKHDSLEPYVKGVLGKFRDDPRVLAWDLYNEPGNDGPEDGMKKLEKRAACLALLEKTFRWAREVAPSQPLTAGVWVGEWVGPKADQLDRFMLANSDVISFHDYRTLHRTIERVGSLKPFGRPIFCTEYLARGAGSRFETHLPYFKENRIAAWNWGMVAGKIQTQYPWSSSNGKFTAEPEIWHHDILRPDGKPFNPEETALLRSLTGRGKP